VIYIDACICIYLHIYIHIHVHVHIDYKFLLLPRLTRTQRWIAEEVGRSASLEQHRGGVNPR